MKARHRLVIILLTIACAFLRPLSVMAATCQPGGGTLDTQIALIPYVGKSEDFQMFNAIMLRKFRSMSSALTGNGLPDVGTIDLQQRQGVFKTWPEEESYVTSNHYLSLWQGMIDSSGQPPQASSNIYLGRFKGQLKDPEVTLPLALKPSDAANTMDTHTMVTFYALAMNAIASKCPASVSKTYLDLALAIYKDLVKHGANGGHVDDIGHAIEAMNQKATLTTP